MTTFLRLLDIPADEKGPALRRTIEMWRRGESPAGVYQVAPSGFRQVPGAPLSYWVSNRVRGLFTTCARVDERPRSAHIGLSTKDDFRHIRAWWEVQETRVALSRPDSTQGKRWVPLAKGGPFAPFFHDLDLVVDWFSDGRILKTTISEYRGSRGWGYNWSAAINGHSEYFRAGLTWPRRTSGLTFRPLPRGAIFGDKGPVLFVEGDDQEMLLGLNALVQSKAFVRLVELQLGRVQLAQSYEVGVVGSTPLPPVARDHSQQLARLAKEAWWLRRSLDSNRQASHVFTLPSLLAIGHGGMPVRSDEVAARRAVAESEFSTRLSRIDELVFHLYGIEGEDRRQMEDGFGSLSVVEAESDGEADDEDMEEAAEGEHAVALIEALLEWTLGVALGRFDVRLATGERQLPPDPDPFDPLPVCSPGMLQSDAGLPATSAPPGYPLDLPPDGILVDDPGHPWDVVDRMEAVIELVAGAQVHGWIQEAEAILGLDLRSWLRRQAFERHLKRYSRSRRKAPIFWHLAPKSREYGVWLYSPVATRDTMYRILNDYVDPRRKGAERRLIEFRQESGDRPTTQQRRELAAQESLVTELRAFREELARVAPLWAPFRDDGVVLNSAVLWRLFDHHRAWQKECKTKWGELAKGKYDWAGWAMHLWPDRVVRACAADRSMAIAHGMEDALWAEGEDGKWTPREDVDDHVARLTAERRSPALEAGLDEFVRSTG